MRRKWLSGITVCIFACGIAHAADAPSFVGRPDAWFATEDSKHVIDNILSWQGKGPSNVMGWPKAYDATKPRPADGGGIEWEGIATIDNGATYSELRILARAVTAEKDEARKSRIKEAFEKGLDAVLNAQYAKGGWPQRFPPSANDYGRHITFNDNAMGQVETLLKDIAG